ncbi:hypothetical protein [Pendulispora albinea]|uniref:Uncharacterized protein n=1 Tax=Pendulispora albinea TaxID=2741071 RepID=A0ABZ2LZG3_9BACT
MLFFVLHRWGASERSKDPSVVEPLLAELDGQRPDDEHIGVSLCLPSGWCLSAFASGLLIFENVEDGVVAPRHMRVGNRSTVRAIMELLARGQFEDLEQLRWRPGEG